MARLLAFLCALALSVTGSAALAQPKFPERGTAPVVDAANVIDDAAEAELSAKLDAFEERTKRQFVVATVPSLDGYDIADYGYQLGRFWGLGTKEDDSGIILLVAPAEHKLRIEVGYGLESIIPDGLAYDIINQDITPRFKAGDMTGGIVAGADRIMTQLELPPEEAQKIAAEAGQRQSNGGGFPVGLIVWLVFLVFFFILPLLARRKGRRYGRGGVGGAVGNVLLWSALNAAMNSGRGGHGGGWSGGGGGGGFSGGGGSFGGGGASGGW
jgi:uncharacterized protein